MPLLDYKGVEQSRMHGYHRLNTVVRALVAKEIGLTITFLPEEQPMPEGSYVIGQMQGKIDSA